MKDNIRAVVREDIDGLKKVIDSSGLFPSEYLEEMISDYLNNANTQEIWFACFNDKSPTAIGYCVPEKLTNGTYNLLAIGVSQNAQRNGVATKMMEYIEQLLKRKGGRILIVETSSDDAQLGARNLYQKLGYTQMAIIKDFWNEGEDKVIFWKKLVV
jgi:ribosomal protein S18 acetylase RimI-like enzyme